MAVERNARKVKVGYVVSDKMGILFDDEIQNRENWKGNSYKETEIFTVLENLR